MNVSNRRALSFVSACVGTLAAIPAPAAEHQLEDVVVTARKVAENLQEVPLAITAITSDEIARRSIRSLSDIAQNTPGLTFFDANTILSTPVIRGLSQTVITAPDRNVGLFYNGVFLSNVYASNFDMFELERIEVVKGPVNALYGRNGFAGAINYVPKQARYGGGPSGSIEGTFGSQSLRGGKGSINLPIGDTLAVRLSGAYEDWDGSWKNLYGGHAGGYENTSGSWDIRWNPTEKLSIGQFGFYVDDSRETNPELVIDNNCGRITGTGTSAANPARPSFFCGEIPPATSIAIPKKEFGVKREGVITGLNVDYDFGPITASVLGGFTNLEQSWLINLDWGTDTRGRPYYMYANNFGPYVPGAQPQGIEYFTAYAGTGPDTTRDMSWELRLASKPGNAFRWMVGGSTYKHYMATTNGIAIDKTGYTGNLYPWSFPWGFVNNGAAFRPMNGLSSLTFFRHISQDDEAGAGFLSLGYTFNDKLTVNGDLRYDKERRKLTDNLTNVVQKRKDEYWTYRASVDYKLDAEKMVYASVAKGVIAGFFNGTSDSLAQRPVPVDLQNYKPSSNITYEIGGKATWLDGRLTTNLAVYYIDYTNLQIQTAPPPPLITTLVSNAASATAQGFELSADGRLSEHVTAGIGYAYTDPKYADDVYEKGSLRFCGDSNPPICTYDANGAVHVGGNPLAHASRHTLNAYVEYAGPLGPEWNWYGRIDGRYQSKQYPRSIDLQWIPGYTIANARIGISKGETWDVELWVKNLTDELIISNATASPLPNPSPVQLAGADWLTHVMMGDRRTYGFVARYKF